jgi:hypothetical protein
MSKKLKTTAILVLTSVTFCVTAVTYKTFRIRLKAEQFLAQFSAVAVGTKQQQVQEIFRHFPEWTRTQECSEDSCQYVFEFQNTWLKTLHLSPWVAFFGSIHVQKGIVRYKEGYLGDGRSFWVRIMDLDCYPCSVARKPFSVQFHGLNPRIYLTPASTREERAVLQNLNLGVLTKVGGLNDSRELLPSSWDYLRKRALEDP